MLALLATDLPDLSGVPAEFIKAFLMTAGFIVIIVLQIRNSTRSAGGAAHDPVHIGQPVQVQHVDQFAPKQETAKAIADINDKVEAMTRENLRQHNDTAKRLAAVLEKGEARRADILQAIHDVEMRITNATLREIRELHQRLNPLAEAVSKHTAHLDALRPKP